MHEQAAGCPSTWENRSRLSLAMFLRQLKTKQADKTEIEREKEGRNFLIAC